MAIMPAKIVEAGIKEGKNVFAMHHLKVRSAPAIFLQEQFAVFAANFVRCAARWLVRTMSSTSGWLAEPGETKVKEQVQVAAHTSAWVIWQDQGCLLMFTDQSLYAGPIPFHKSAMGASVAFAVWSKCCFLTFKALCSLVAQNLR